MASGNGKVTPVMSLMLNLFADGAPHRYEEIHACLHEQDAPSSNVRAALTRLRYVLRPQGKDIFVQYINRRIHWRMARVISRRE